MYGILLNFYDYDYGLTFNFFVEGTFCKSLIDQSLPARRIPNNPRRKPDEISNRVANVEYIHVHRLREEGANGMFTRISTHIDGVKENFISFEHLPLLCPRQTPEITLLRISFKTHSIHSPRRIRSCACPP